MWTLGLRARVRSRVVLRGPDVVLMCRGGEAFYFVLSHKGCASPLHPRERRYLLKTTFSPPHTHMSRPSPPLHPEISLLKCPPCDSIHAARPSQTIGGVTYGISKKVTIVSVQVLSCRGSGPWSGVIAGGQMRAVARAGERWENGGREGR